MNSASPAIKSLDRLQIPYRLFVHSAPPASLEQAASERGQDPGQVIRSIVFRQGKGNYIMVLIAGPGQISWKHVRRYLGTSRISLAGDEEVKRITGYEIGTVNPFGLSDQIRILADSTVFVPEEISLGSGIHGTAIIIKSSDLRRILGKPEIGIFHSEP